MLVPKYVADVGKLSALTKHLVAQANALRDHFLGRSLHGNIFCLIIIPSSIWQGSLWTLRLQLFSQGRSLGVWDPHQ